MSILQKMTTFVFENQKTCNMEKLQTYFSLHAEELIAQAGMKKYEFADKLGVARQNLKKVVIDSNNIQMLNKAAQILGVPLSTLIGIEKEKSRINGFIEVDGNIHKITSKEDLMAIIEKINLEPIHQ